MVWLAVALFALPLAISAGVTALLIRKAPRWGLVDHPAARKVHVEVTPLGGGIAIYSGLVATTLLVLGAGFAVERQWVPDGLVPEIARVHAAGVVSKAPLLLLILAAATVQMLLGLADDWKRGGLGYQVRLLVEVGLVLALAALGVKISIFTQSPWLTWPLTVLWIVGSTNAVNFLDNMDGLAGGVAFWASAMLLAVGLLVGSLFVAGSFLVLMGALAGFLLFNWPPAKIFMGDAGSNFVGFWLGTLTVVATFSISGYDHVTVLAPLCILAVPIYDSSTVIALRLWQGRSPFHPDKQHLSHRLVELGFRQKHAVMLIHLLTATTGLGGVLLYFVEPKAAPLVLLQVGCQLAVLALLELAAVRKARTSALNRHPVPAAIDAAPALRE